MHDPMLTELYKRVFDSKREAEFLSSKEGKDNLRQVALAKNALLSELIDIRTNQIRNEGNE